MNKTPRGLYRFRGCFFSRCDASDRTQQGEGRATDSATDDEEQRPTQRDKKNEHQRASTCDHYPEGRPSREGQRKHKKHRKRTTRVSNACRLGLGRRVWGDFPEAEGDIGSTNKTQKTNPHDVGHLPGGPGEIFQRRTSEAHNTQKKHPHNVRHLPAGSGETFRWDTSETSQRNRIQRTPIMSDICRMGLG